VLCYDLEVRTLADWCELDEEAYKRFRLLPNFAKDRLRLLPKLKEKVDFVNLALVGVLNSFLFFRLKYWTRTTELEIFFKY